MALMGVGQYVHVLRTLCKSRQTYLGILHSKFVQSSPHILCKIPAFGCNLADIPPPFREMVPNSLSNIMTYRYVPRLHFQPSLHFIVNTLVQYIEMAMANNCNNNKKHYSTDLPSKPNFSLRMTCNKILKLLQLQY